MWFSHETWGRVGEFFLVPGEKKIEAASAKTAKASAKPKGETEGETKKRAR